MRAEIDQSGKVEWLQKPTVLALANGVKYSVVLPAQTKREIFAELERRRPARSRVAHRILVFATVVFLLLKDYIRKLNQVRVDVEYQGYTPIIKDHVLNLLRRQGIVIYSQTIEFHWIGKKSPAHDLALKVFKGKVSPSRRVTAKEVLAEFRK